MKKPELKRLTTYFEEGDELLQVIEAEAKQRRLSQAATLRQLLREWHERRERQERARGEGEGDAQL